MAYPAATVDIKKNIFDLCTDTRDCYLAVIEVDSAPRVLAAAAAAEAPITRHLKMAVL